MGVDAEIYFELLDGEAPDLGYGFQQAAGECKPEGSTNRLNTRGVRYYGIGYERGPWPTIASDLMELMSAENVGRVWYFGDCEDPEKAQPFSLGDLIVLTMHYVANGNRPYRNRSNLPIK